MVNCQKSIEVSRYSRKCPAKSALLADNWDAAIYEAWRSTIENFDHVYFEAYLLNGEQVTRIRI